MLQYLRRALPNLLESGMGPTQYYFSENNSIKRIPILCLFHKQTVLAYYYGCTCVLVHQTTSKSPLSVLLVISTRKLSP